ncbi:hypothetical protein HK57_00661 [Aspergillus ustus]|uniref:DUF6546 domain-containing protein n=1 Tax=Aspergillus ustus TaxID=40382 RepID=A0A0C1E5Z0_ASPUT|nr:hypothetical protein HK57_00661 [Aspergillus ustus]
MSQKVAQPKGQEAKKAQLTAAEATLSPVLQRCNGVHSVKAAVSTCDYDLEPHFLPISYGLFDQTSVSSRISSIPVLNLSNRERLTNRYKQLSDRALFRIASSCRSLYNLTLQLSHISTSDMMDLSRQKLRRQVIADGIKALAPTVCSLDLDTQTSNDFSFVDIKSSANDNFSKSLWDISTRLDRLEMTNTALPLDFWFPESEYRKDSTSPHWPDLFAIYCYRDPALRFIHSNIIPQLPDNSRDAFDLMDTFFVSLGHAAQRVPWLATISYGLGMIHPTEFLWTRDDHGRRDVEAEAYWCFPCNYIPSEKVAAAWGFRLADIVTKPGQVPNWKAAFEPRIYGALHCYCTVFPEGIQLSSLSVIDRWTSGAAGVSRRRMVRHLECTIQIKYYQAGDDITHPNISSIQKINDDGYKSAVAALFDVLKTWDNSCRVALQLCVEYSYTRAEPQTKYSTLGTCSTANAGFMLPNTTIPDVQCITKLDIGADQSPRDQLYSVSMETQMEVAQHCTRLNEVCVPFLNEGLSGTPESHYDKQRRAFANGLRNLSPSLWVFRVWEDDGKLSGLSRHLSGEEDPLATNMGLMSLRLRHLKLYRARLPLDFLFPLDTSSDPIHSSRHWPNLEVLENDQAPHVTNAVSTGERELIYAGMLNNSTSPPPRTRETFDRLFISSGYAARQMPRLATLDYTTGSGSFSGKYSIFKFSNDQATRTVTATWTSTTGYKPDERVAKAWGFRLSDMTITYDGASATSKIELSPWLPAPI